LEKNPTSALLLTVVAAALADGEGRVLLQQRPAGKAMAGLWEFPGGKVEAGERPEAALVRELREELGIEVDPARLEPAAFASAGNGERHMVLLLYVCRVWEGEPRPLDAAGFRWLTPREMATSEMPPADVPLVAALERLNRRRLQGSRKRYGGAAPARRFGLIG
jgi:8-oxo-dGTP diphosphatase